MPASKIQNAREVEGWIEEGRTYRWMVEEYERKYNLEVSPTMFSNFRARRGLSRRLTRNTALIPWEVKREHRWNYNLAMLRAEARRRDGKLLRDDEAGKLSSWKRHLLDENAVVHYEPETEQGWFLVPRREGVDLDLIRVPSKGLTQRQPVF